MRAAAGATGGRWRSLQSTPTWFWYSRTGLAVRVGLSVLGLALVLRLVPLERLAARLAALDLRYVVAAVLLLAAHIALTGIRWTVVVRTLGSDTKWSSMLRFTFIGVAASQLLPTSVGGDVARAWLHHRAGAPMEHAIVGSLVDRCIGIVTLLAMAAVPLVGLYTDSWTPILGLFVLFAGLAACVPLVVRKSIRAKLTANVRPRWLARVGSVGLTPFRRLRPVLTATALSVASHVGSVAAFWLLVRATGASVGLLQAAPVVLVSQLLATLPLAIAGWGIRESVVVAGLAVMGVSSDAAFSASLLFGLAFIVVSLPTVLFRVLVPSDTPCTADKIGGTFGDL